MKPPWEVVEHDTPPHHSPLDEMHDLVLDALTDGAFYAASGGDLVTKGFVCDQFRGGRGIDVYVYRREAVLHLTEEQLKDVHKQCREQLSEIWADNTKKCGCLTCGRVWCKCVVHPCWEHYAKQCKTLWRDPFWHRVRCWWWGTWPSRARDKFRDWRWNRRFRKELRK